MIKIVFDNNLNSSFKNFGSGTSGTNKGYLETMDINKYFTLNTNFCVRITTGIDDDFVHSPLFDECSFTLVFSKSLL